MQRSALMKQTYLITGYPGFLASSLTEQLINDHQQDIGHIYLFVLPNFENQASKQITSFAKKSNLDSDLFTIITGDITKAGLAIEPSLNHTLQHSVTHVFHLAGVYDLAVPKDIAFRVNLEGTRNVNNWVKTLNKLNRYIYFSTAYVSGTREGRVYERELSKGQTFRNHYEHTKYEAELLVEKLKKDVPTTIIRPGIVKGHSKTGHTIKFDGLYFMLNLIDHLSFLPVIPYFGDGGAEGNFVPSDYVLEATSYFAIAAIGEGKTYHLADPNPYTIRELHQILQETYLGKSPKGTIPMRFAKHSLSRSRIQKWLQVEKETLDYFSIHSSYDCSQAVEDLAGTGIVCPDLKDTVPSMIEFYRKYKHDQTKHIQIS